MTARSKKWSPARDVWRYDSRPLPHVDGQLGFELAAVGYVADKVDAKVRETRKQ